MPELEQHIGGRSGGVDASIFSPKLKDREYVTKGVSGQRRLRCQVGDRLVKILDVDHTDVGYLAQVADDRLTVYVKNIEPSGDLHPDIYPGHLLQRSFDYFQSVGTTIAEVAAKWWLSTPSEPSVNYDTYTALIAQIDNPTEEDQKAAAQQTWTGKQLATLGYGHVKEVFARESLVSNRILSVEAIFVPSTEKEQHILFASTLEEENAGVDWAGNGSALHEWQRTL